MLLENYGRRRNYKYPVLELEAQFWPAELTFVKVDKNIMDHTFGTKVDKSAESLNNEEWTKELKMGIWMGETGGAYNSGRNTV